MKPKPVIAKKTRSLEKSRKQLLEATFLEVFSKGFQGVSIDEILKKTALTKGALYHQFPTKLDLGYALVEEVITPMILDRWITPLEDYENPVEGILYQLQRNIGDARPEDLRLGCPLNNLVQEMSPLDKGFRQRLQAALNLWVDQMETQLKRAKKAGHIRSEVNVRDVALFVVMAHEGFYGIIKGFEDPALFRPLFKSLRSYFSSLS
ncbi:MAG: TetR/AcrR family transcriptional regulator [Bdellovibrionota bacterium]